MTGPQSVDIREIQFVGDADKGFSRLPDDIRQTIVALLNDLQNDKPLPPKKVTDLKGDLAGISELRQDYDTNTYRAYYLARFREVIFVLDVEMKKSAHGSAIPQPTKAMLKQRLRVAERMYETHKSEYQADYAARAERKTKRDARLAARHGTHRRPT